MDAEERAVKALFGDKPFTVNDLTAGERDGYAISIPALTRAIQAAVKDERDRCATICYDVARQQRDDPERRKFADDLGNMIGAIPIEEQ